MELTSGFIHLITKKVLKVYAGDLAIGAMTAITSINFIYYKKYFVKILQVYKYYFIDFLQNDIIYF